MHVLGIESSCDDTSVALLECSERGCFILSEKTASQIKIHQKYGGVVPEIAGRMHAEKIVPLIEEVLKDQPKPDVITVTTGPGLITGLIVGVEAARTLSYALDIPVVAVNHLEGHISSVEISNFQFPISNKIQNPKTKTDKQFNNLTIQQFNNIQYPALALIASGGHTELVYMEEQGNYNVVGKTVDDAAGECFDKIAKLLDLPYPGGPQISTLAETGNTSAINFPRPMIKEDNLNFSFSGLKTSALYWLRDNKLGDDIIINDFCASFEQAIIDVLVAKTLKAAEKYHSQTIILAGGVSANKKLREVLQSQLSQLHPTPHLLLPSPAYCMDNAAMIAIAGYYRAIKKEFTPWGKLAADPNLKLI